MYSLIRSMPIHRFAMTQLPPLVGAFIIAELFYKFHSFALECGAFLATWFVFDALVESAASRISGKRPS